MSKFPALSAYPVGAPGTLAETLWLNARHFGARTAVATAIGTLTHADLFRRGHRLAAALGDAGIGRSDRVAMLSMNRTEMAEIYAATELSGIPVVPLNFRLSAAEQIRILEDSRPALVFFEERYADLVAEIRPRLPADLQWVCIGTATDWAEDYETFAARAQPFRNWSAFEPASLACILYTSGTTGEPKGVMHTHAGFRALGSLMTLKMGLTASDRGLIMMPLFHMGGKSVQLGVHWSGGTLFVHDRFDPAHIAETIARERITMVHMAPTMIQALLDEPGLSRRDLSSLRVVFYSAAPMAEPVLRRGLDLLGPVFVQSYGQTEGSGTVLPAACHLPDGSPEDRRRLVSVGVPPRGVDIRVVRDTGAPCAPGEPGEVLLQTPCAMAGYWNNPAATADALQDGWLRTGDVGYRDEAGFLFLVDRKKDVIISGGENIYTREVENVLLAHAGVADAAVIGVPHEKWGEAVCAVIVPQAGARLSAVDIEAHCRSLIASYKRPQVVHFTDDMPRLASGKVDKKVLRRRFGAGLGVQ